jgi:hypothetical protein
MTKSPSKKLDQSSYRKTSFRIPPDLYDEITADAERNGRSINAEIIARLRADQFADILSEMADVKAMIRKLLDKS